VVRVASEFFEEVGVRNPIVFLEIFLRSLKLAFEIIKKVWDQSFHWGL
jgi:hypothetical protein